MIRFAVFDVCVFGKANKFIRTFVILHANELVISGYNINVVSVVNIKGVMVSWANLIRDNSYYNIIVVFYLFGVIKLFTIGVFVRCFFDSDFKPWLQASTVTNPLA